MDYIFYLRILCTICWTMTGIIRMGIYINSGDSSNIIIAIMSFVCAIFWGLTVYCSFI